MSHVKTLSGEKVQNRILEHGKCLLQKATHCTIISDIWTNQAMKSFISFIATFLDEDFTRKYVYCALTYFPECHTSQNIRRKYDDIIEAIVPISTVVLRTVTDTASNIKAAFNNHFGEEVEMEIPMTMADEEDEGTNTAQKRCNNISRSIREKPSWMQDSVHVL